MSELYKALCAAQAEMSKAKKDSTNPHFRSSYADLSSVMDACMPALSKHGLCLLQEPGKDENGHYLLTRIIHGESGESAEWRTPVMMTKEDAQGYGSALTYARRYGLMCVGIAPADDDGNAASAPQPVASKPVKTLLNMPARPYTALDMHNDRKADKAKPSKEVVWAQVLEQSGKMACFTTPQEFVAFAERYLKTPIDGLTVPRMLKLGIWLKEYPTLETWPEAAKSCLQEARTAIEGTNAF